MDAAGEGKCLRRRCSPLAPGAEPAEQAKRRGAAKVFTISPGQSQPSRRRGGAARCSPLARGQSQPSRRRGEELPRCSPLAPGAEPAEQAKRRGAAKVFTISPGGRASRAGEEERSCQGPRGQSQPSRRRGEELPRCSPLAPGAEPAEQAKRRGAAKVFTISPGGRASRAGEEERSCQGPRGQSQPSRRRGEELPRCSPLAPGAEPAEQAKRRGAAKVFTISPGGRASRAGEEERSCQGPRGQSQPSRRRGEELPRCSPLAPGAEPAEQAKRRGAAKVFTISPGGRASRAGEEERSCQGPRGQSQPSRRRGEELPRCSPLAPGAEPAEQAKRRGAAKVFTISPGGRASRAGEEERSCQGPRGQSQPSRRRGEELPRCSPLAPGAEPAEQAKRRGAAKVFTISPGGRASRAGEEERSCQGPRGQSQPSRRRGEELPRCSPLAPGAEPAEQAKRRGAAKVFTISPGGRASRAGEEERSCQGPRGQSQPSRRRGEELPRCSPLAPGAEPAEQAKRRGAAKVFTISPGGRASRAGEEERSCQGPRGQSQPSRRRGEELPRCSPLAPGAEPAEQAKRRGAAKVFTISPGGRASRAGEEERSCQGPRGQSQPSRRRGEELPRCSPLAPGAEPAEQAKRRGAAKVFTISPGGRASRAGEEERSCQGPRGQSQPSRRRGEELPRCSPLAPGAEPAEQAKRRGAAKVFTISPGGRASRAGEEERSCQGLYYDYNNPQELYYDYNNPQELYYDYNNPQELYYDYNNSQELYYDYNNPQELYYDYNNPQELYYDYNNPQELYYDYNNSQELYYDYNNPQELYYDYNNPQELYYDYNNPQELYYDYNNPQELYYDYNNPQELYYDYNNPQELYYDYNNPQELYYDYNNPQELYYDYNNPQEL
ncbi:unnamed protein product [Nezara viridula]|uniref:Uncharacterized protein n=1 Tax=Nezara viridula TaxID=85310 RepID=A0A9P0MMH3_NEZVI|nr:unnamed protein product [Nezara viridula]